MTNPVTPEFAIAVSSGSNTPEPRLTTLADGRLLATWYDIGSNGGDIRHRIFDVDGTALTAELTTPAATAGTQTAHSVAALTNGGFVVVWQDFAADALGDVRYRVFDAAGNQVATGLATTGEQAGSRQADPTVTGTADGGFVIAWTDRNATNSGRPEGTDAVVARAFSAAGVALDGIVRISGETGGGVASEIAADDQGIVGIWDDNTLDGIYAAGGDTLPVADQTDDGIRIGDAAMAEAARTPDIAVTSAGIVAVWEQFGRAYCQIETAFGLGQVIALSNAGFVAGPPRIAALPFGGFVVTWDEFRNPSGAFTSFDVFARVFDAAGNPVGTEPVNLTQGQTGAEFGPDVTALIDGRFMLSWSSQGALGDVIGRLYDPRTAPIFWESEGLGSRVVGTDIAGRGDTLLGNFGDDRLWGQDGNDWLSGGAANDSLFGGRGNDILDGGEGNDTMEGGLGNDIYTIQQAGDVIQGEVAFGAGGGIDTVRVFIDGYVQGANIELVRMGNPTDGDDFSITGNDAPGTLVGNAGSNTLNGRGGNDQVNGNAGNDTIIGGEGRDTLVGGAGADTFVFTSISNSRAGAANRDVINGFTRAPGDQDIIDLSAIDANTLTPGVNNAFSFIGTAAFAFGGASAGQLRLVSLGGPNAVVVEADINGDRVADFQIFINGQTTMLAGDFLL